MTERGRVWVRRSPNAFVVGSSALAWDGRGLDIFIDERCAPFPRRLRGHVRLDAESLNPKAFELAAEGRHLWRPIAPLARVRAEFYAPRLTWSGHGYFDMNRGDEPLENAFSRWTWSRARTPAGARVFYDAERRREGSLGLSLNFAEDGRVSEDAAPDRAALAKTLWRLPRLARSEGPAKVLRTLEDTPFYARTRIAHELYGESATSMHESLDLDRFARPIVKAMLPFRMPRI